MLEPVPNPAQILDPDILEESNSINWYELSIDEFDLDKKVMYLTEQLKTEPDHKETLQRRSELLICLGLYDDAIKDA